MKHDHPHGHTMRHPHAIGHHVTVRHSHEHSHTTSTAAYGRVHRMHRHTPAQEADIRKQQRA